MPNVAIDPPSAITDEAVTRSNDATNTRRCRPRSSVLPKSGVVRPPSSAMPRIQVMAPVEVENASSRVGRKTVIQRSARFEVDFAAVSATSSARWLLSTTSSPEGETSV